MMTLSILEVLWFFLIFVLIAGYFILDGFDLGVGVLFPFVAKGEEEKQIARRSIGPVWDGNEVWLLTAGGALFAAFPDAYATTFSGFYLAIMLVLFGLIVRAVSFEFRAGDPKWRGLWDGCFFVGSLLPALLMGVAVGNIYAGIPMDANGDYMGVPLLGLISPFTLACGLLGLAMFLAAGATWLALKAPLGSALQARSMKLRLPLQVAALALFVVVSLLGHFAIAPEMDPALGLFRWASAAVVLVALVASMVVGKLGEKAAAKAQAEAANAPAVRPGVNPTPGKLPVEVKPFPFDLVAFVAQSAAALFLVVLLACSMFPVLVMATPDSIGPAITIANAASSELSLIWMTIMLGIGLPLVLIYHVIIYRTFRGRVKPEDIRH